MRIRTDRDLCIGSGQCALLAPDVFDQDEEDGLVVVLEEHPGGPLQPAVRTAARMCPMRAIEIVGE